MDVPPLRREPGDALAEGVDRKLVLLVLGGILCLGMALGLELFPHFSGRDLRTVRLAPIAGRVMETLVLPEPPPQSRPATFEQLMQILSPRKADPAALRFSEAFFASADLRRIYDDFAKTPERSAYEFVAVLQKSADFGDLMRSHSRQPEFRELAEALTRHPEVNRLLRALRSQPSSRGSSPLPNFAPSNRSADTLGAEAKGKASPVGAIKAPGRPVEDR